MIDFDWRANRTELSHGRTVDVDGVPIWIHDDGAGGEPLVLLGGFSVGHFQFDPVRSHLREHRLITWQPRGFGPSYAPADGPYSVEIWTDDLLRVLDALEIERAHVWGHAFGSYIAICLAGRHADRVGALVAFPDVWYGDPSKQYAKVWRVYGAIIEEFGVSGFGARALAGFYDVQEPAWAREWLAAAIEDVIHPATADATIGWGCREADVRPYLPRVAAPTLILHGTGGWTGDAPPDNPSLDLMRAHIRDHEVATIDGHGNFFPTQRPEETAATITAFLRRHPIGS